MATTVKSDKVPPACENGFPGPVFEVSWPSLAETPFMAGEKAFGFKTSSQSNACSPIRGTLGSAG